MNLISADMNHKQFMPFRVAAFNKELGEAFDNKLKVGSISCFLAAHTTIEFMDKNTGCTGKAGIIGAMQR